MSRGKLLTEFFGDQLLPDITARDVKRFKSSLKSTETPRGSLRSGSTVNRYIYLLSAVCSHAIGEEVMSENPCARINDEPEKERERYLTSDEQERMLDIMVDDLDYLRAPFELSLHTGLRKNVELLKLKVGHFELHFASCVLSHSRRERRDSFELANRGFGQARKVSLSIQYSLTPFVFLSNTKASGDRSSTDLP